MTIQRGLQYLFIANEARSWDHLHKKETNGQLRARVALILAASDRLADAHALRDALLSEATGKDYVESDLLGVSGSMPTDEALEWIRKVWSRSGPARKSMDHFMLGKYCETLEQIGTRKASEELQALAAAGSDFDATTPLIHLERIATGAIQDWTISIARTRADRPIQRWCARILGGVGDTGAQQHLERCLADDDPVVRTIAFEGLMRIHEREGTLWFGGQELLDVNSASER